MVGFIDSFTLSWRKNVMDFTLFKIEESRSVSRVLSWTVIHLIPLSPEIFSNLPEDHVGHMPLARALLFGLAPGGVYLAVTVTSNAVRSYRTISTLPAIAGGILSVALAMSSRSPGVTWHLALRSPDFPPLLKTAATVSTNSPGNSTTINARISRLSNIRWPAYIECF